MKTRKVLALAGVTLLAAGVLAACSGGSATKGEQTFAFTYETDPDKSQLFDNQQGSYFKHY